MQTNRLARVVTAASLLFWSAVPAHAAPITWVGGNATSPQWDQPANWSGGAKPTAADDLTFPTPIPATPGATIVLGAGELANSLAFDDAYTLSAGSLTLTAGNGGNVTVASGVNATIASVLQGANAPLTKLGAGTLVLSGNNTFTGPITISAGVLSFAAVPGNAVLTGNLGATTTPITLDGGTLRYTGAARYPSDANTANQHNFIVTAAGGTFDVTNAAGQMEIRNAAGSLTGPAGATINKTGAGILRLAGANATLASNWNLSAGTLEAGTATALGTGQITVNGGNLSGGGDLANALVLNGGTISPVNGNRTFSGTVSVTADSTISLKDWYQAVNRNLTLSNAITGSNSLTTTQTAGTASGQSLTLNGNNAGFSGAITGAAGHNLNFGSAAAMGTGTVTINSTAAALGGIGVAFDAIPTFTNARTGTTTGGVFGVNTNTFATPLDLSTLGGGMLLGSQTAGTYTAATLTPNGDTYTLGGGGGTLTIANPVITGATNLTIGDARANGGGTVVIGSTAQDFTGNLTINQGTLSTAVFTNIGTNATIPLGSAAAGGFTYTGATGALARDFTAGAGGGTITVSTDAATLTVNKVTGGAFTKSGAGQLTITNADPATVAALTVNGDQVATATVLATALAAAQNTATTLGNGATTVTGSVNVGNNGNAARLVVPAGTTLTAGGGAASDVNLGSRNVGTVNNANWSVGILDASAANGVTFNVNNVRLGVDFQSTTANGSMNGVLRLPTAGAAVNTITALNAFTLADSNTEGNDFATLNLGGGATTVTTPTLLVGGRKGTATIDVAAGGRLTLSNGANRTALTVGSNTNVDTGTTPVANFNMTGGTIVADLGAVIVGNRSGGGATGKATGTLNFGAGATTDVDVLVATGNALRAGLLTYGGGAQPTGETSTGTVTFGGGTASIVSNDPAANVAAVVLGNFSATTAISGAAANNAATGTLNVTGGTVTVDAAGANPAIALALRSVAAGTVGTNTSTGAVNVSGGTLRLLGPVAGNNVAGQQVSNLSLTGGVLDMTGKNISNISNLAFTGGTLLNLGTLNQALAQNGPTSLLDVADNDATVSGAYTLSDGVARLASGRVLSAASATIADTLVETVTGGPTPTSSRLALTGTLDLTATSDVLRVVDPVNGLPFDGTSSYTLATYASLAGGAHFDSVEYFNGTTTLTGTDAQATTPGGLFPNGYALQYTDTALILAPVPEPATLSLFAIGALGLLARRRR